MLFFLIRAWVFGFWVLCFGNADVHHFVDQRLLSTSCGQCHRFAAPLVLRCVHLASVKSRRGLWKVLGFGFSLPFESKVGRRDAPFALKQVSCCSEIDQAHLVYLKMLSILIDSFCFQISFRYQTVIVTGSLTPIIPTLFTDIFVFVRFMI